MHAGEDISREHQLPPGGENLTAAKGYERPKSGQFDASAGKTAPGQTCNVLIFARLGLSSGWAIRAPAVDRHAPPTVTAAAKYIDAFAGVRGYHARFPIGIG